MLWLSGKINLKRHYFLGEFSFTYKIFSFCQEDLLGFPHIFQVYCACRCEKYLYFTFSSGVSSYQNTGVYDIYFNTMFYLGVSMFNYIKLIFSKCSPIFSSPSLVLIEDVKDKPLSKYVDFI